MNLRRNIRPESAKMQLPSAKLNASNQDSFTQKKSPFPPRPQSAQVPKLGPVADRKKNSSINNREMIMEEEDDELQYGNGMNLNAILLNPPSAQVQDTRKMPKNIKKDKEKLYEELLETKQQMNKIKEENVRLKTKMLTLQKDNGKLEKLLENVEGYLHNGSNSHQPIGDHILMNSLKKQLKETKNFLQEKEGELAQVKRNLKVTKIQELEAELKGYVEETIRLRSLLDQALRNQAAQKMALDMDSYEEKFYIQMKVINSLQQEIDNFSANIKLKEEDIFNLNLELEKLTQEKERHEQNGFDLETKINEKNDKIDYLEKEILKVKNLNNELIIKSAKADSDKQKSKELEDQFKEAKSTISDQKKQIDLLEKQMNDMKTNYQQSFSSLERERKNYENEMERYKILYEQVDEKYKNALYQNAQGTLIEDHEEIKNGQKQNTQSSQQNYQRGKTIQQIFEKEHDQQNDKLKYKDSEQLDLNDPLDKIRSKSKPNMLRRRRTVKKEDVKDIGLEMNLRFRIRKLKLEDIINNVQLSQNIIQKDLFDPLILSRGTISIRDIAVRLSNSPFELKNVEDIYLVARYLVEDNTQDYIDYDEDQQQTTQIVSSVFRKLIGQCKIFTSEEETKCKEELHQQILKYRKSILSYLPTLKSQYLTRNEIQYAFKYMGLVLSSDSMDFFFLRLFELGGEKDVKTFDYRKIVEEWGQDDDRVANQLKKQRKGNSQQSSKQDIVQSEKNIIASQLNQQSGNTPQTKKQTLFQRFAHDQQ